MSKHLKAIIFSTVKIKLSCNSRLKESNTVVNYYVNTSENQIFVS